jgi:iron complex transport system substrate-binding protein
VVALAPNLAEIIADFGGGGQLVGISSYGRVPEGAEAAQRVGGFTDPSIERIIELRPDLVVGVPLQGGVLASCRDAGLRTLEVDCQTVEQVLKVYATLGNELGRGERAGEVSRQLRARLDAVRRQVAGQPRPRTLFLLGLAGENLQQVFPVGPGNFGHELLVLAGGRNVLNREIPSISAEAMITLRPEVIIEVSMDEEGGREEVLTPSPFWARIPSTPAVQSGRVYALRSTSLLVPGPRMADGAELLARLLHQ